MGIQRLTQAYFSDFYADLLIPSGNEEAPPVLVWHGRGPDVTDSTGHWLADPHGMAEALAIHDDIINTVIEDSGGWLFTTAGDSFHTAYLDPVTALTVAVGSRRALAQASWGRLGSLHPRYALHIGWAEWRPWDFFGPDVILCARLLDVASADQIVVSEPFLDSLPDDHREQFAEVGVHRLKGFDSPVRVFTVVDEC